MVTASLVIYIFHFFFLCLILIPTAITVKGIAMMKEFLEQQIQSIY